MVLSWNRAQALGNENTFRRLQVHKRSEKAGTHIMPKVWWKNTEANITEINKYYGNKQGRPPKLDKQIEEDHIAKKPKLT